MVCRTETNIGVFRHHPVPISIRVHTQQIIQTLKHTHQWQCHGDDAEVVRQLRAEGGEDTRRDTHHERQRLRDELPALHLARVSKGGGYHPRCGKSQKCSDNCT